MLAGALFSGLAAVLHLGCIVFGGDWYRFFGAGEQMAQLAEAGDPLPAIVTTCVAAILLTWSLYALSGAKRIARLPFLRPGLITISAIYLLRGLAFPLIVPMFPGNSMTFWYTSSLVCSIIGASYAIGTWQSWSSLGSKVR